jgi:hypothetical protein
MFTLKTPNSKNPRNYVLRESISGIGADIMIFMWLLILLVKTAKAGNGLTQLEFLIPIIISIPIGAALAIIKLKLNKP